MSLFNWQRASTHVVALALVALVFLKTSLAFYLPGVAPYSYETGEDVILKVNKLSSVKTQLPFNYYSLKFCRPQGGIKSYNENLGELLSGDRIENSPYDIHMMEDTYCRILCQVNLGPKDVTDFKNSVRQQYHHNWIVDNLPAASILENESFSTTQYIGFPVGYQSGSSLYLYNHVNIILEYHPVEDDLQRIVGFYVEPLSVGHSFVQGAVWDGKGLPPLLSTCPASRHLSYNDVKGNPQKIDVGPVVFTYDVTWRESDVKWASRWDVYLSMNGSVSDKVHWFSIVNALLIVLFLAFMVAMILVRTLHRDINKYNRLPTDEEKAEEREETGWKLIHADVFRPPVQYPMLFCVAVGTGMQLVCCAFLLILFSAIGFLSPANRGSVMIGLLVFFVLLGAVAGFTSARLYKTFKGKQWQRCTLLTALGFPGIVFSFFFLMNLIVWSLGSTGAVPFSTLLGIVLLWFGVSVPLVFLGAYVAYRREPIEFPVISSNIPREIPEQPWYLSTPIVCLVGGILPFGACFVELFFVMSSLWMDQYYYVFGFLLLVFIILAITCAEIAIVLNYFQLCSEDYHWWWRSLLVPGATAGYVFLYSVFYFARIEATAAVAYMLYFGYMTVISLGIFLITGTIGFVSCFLFNYHIYGSIKVD